MLTTSSLMDPNPLTVVSALQFSSFRSPPVVFTLVDACIVLLLRLPPPCMLNTEQSSGQFSGPCRSVLTDGRRWSTHPQESLRFSFNFDATVSGYMAAGFWRSIHAPEWRTIMRSLVQLLQTRHGQHAIDWVHVKAHQGHSWNECADALAKFAATAPSAAMSSPWEEWIPNRTLFVPFNGFGIWNFFSVVILEFHSYMATL